MLLYPVQQQLESDYGDRLHFGLCLGPRPLPVPPLLEAPHAEQLRQEGVRRQEGSQEKDARVAEASCKLSDELRCFFRRKSFLAKQKENGQRDENRRLVVDCILILCNVNMIHGIFF